MINAVATAQRLDWSGWFEGLWGAFITSAAGAASAAIGTMVVDPGDFNLHGGIRKLFEVMAVSALIPGMVSLLKFLQMHPLPDKLQEALKAAAANVQVEAQQAVEHAQAAQDAAVTVKDIAKDVKP